MPAVCYLILFLCLISPVQSSNFSRPTFISVKSGEHVTFNCLLIESDIGHEMVIWYKQIFREMPQKVGEGAMHNEVNLSPEFQTSGFKIEKTDNSISLTIPQVNKEHGGLYYCGHFNWDKVDVKLSDGTFLTVTDDRDVKEIFGNETRVQLKEHVDPVVICLSIALGVCVVVIIVQAFISCKWRTCQQHTQRQKTKRRQEKTSPQVHDSMELNYAALHFKKKQTKTERQKKKQPQDTVYSDVRSLTTT